MRRIASIIMILAFLALCACSNAASGIHSVTYEVSGNSETTSADIDYVNDDGIPTKVASASLSWTYSYKSGGTDILYVSAYSLSSSAAGTITATVYVDGSALETMTQTGAYTTATASVGLSD